MTEREHRTKTIRFSEDDLELFSAASHDKNPLHLSSAYARRSPYGERVVFGVLGGLMSLGRLRERPGYALSEIALDFYSPLFLDISYTLEIDDRFPEQSTAVVYDGSQAMARATVRFRPGNVNAEPGDGAAAGPTRAEAAVPADSDLAVGLLVEGRYAPASAGLLALARRVGLAERGIGAVHVAALLWASYLVGMEIPGRRALFSRLSLRFQPVPADGTVELDYDAKVTGFDKRFSLLKLGVTLRVRGALLADGEITTFVREERLPEGSLALESLLPRSEALRGMVSLVIGASRGLGASIAQSLALQGSTVLANFLQSKPEAERLEQSLADAPGGLVLLPGEAGDLAWNREARDRIVAEYGRLDFLICNACPAPLPLVLHPDTVGRINDYVLRSLTLVSVPMATFLPVVAENSGWQVTVSSSYVQTTPAEWPQYVAAKSAVEGLTRVAAREYGAASYLIVRPPRLVTDLTNTPLGRHGALPPERIAANVVKRLKGPAAPGMVETLESFLPAGG